MKKQAIKNGQDAVKMSAGKDTVSRVLLIGAIILYSVSLMLLANLALADGIDNTYGALIKVNNRLDGNAFGKLNASVKSVHGNVLSIDIKNTDYVNLNKVAGVCDSHLDHVSDGSAEGFNAEFFTTKYAGADVVVGILSNGAALDAKAMSQLKKVEPSENVGFISYRSDDPNSTVIIHNLKGGESNLVQALAYMQDYAKTVNKPLIIELDLKGPELQNPLFVQVCQRVAESGVQFLGAPDFTTGYTDSKAPLQLAFTMFNSATGKITDQSDFWAIDEVKGQKIMLMGSDEKLCAIDFIKESGFDKIFMSNTSDDIVMVMALNADGEVNYYHVTNKETALIPRELLNGTPVLEDGLDGIYPFHTKMAMFNGAAPQNQFVALGKAGKQVDLGRHSGMAVSVGSPEARTLAMSLQNLDPQLKIEIRDQHGETVYLNRPDTETKSIQTKIDLSEGAEGLYFLDLTSPQFHQTFALLMD